MIAILKAATAKGYALETSINKELPDKLLKTDEADFIAGYVFQACREEVGNLVSGSSKFAKGQQAYQRSCVDMAHSKSRHLKKGGDKSLEERFSNMTSFTQAYWSVRTRILNLIKSLRKKRPTTIVSFLKSKQELEKLIHTEVKWHNRGVFRSEEIIYLDSENHEALEALNAFRDRLSTPTERLATHFEDEYAPIRRGIRAAEAKVDTLINRRSSILFIPNAKKKRDIEYNKLSLLNKLAEFTETSKQSAFLPSTLPGIRLVNTNLDIFAPVVDNLLLTTWIVVDGNDTALDVVTSWNAFLSVSRTRED